MACEKEDEIQLIPQLVEQAIRIAQTDVSDCQLWDDCSSGHRDDP